MRWMVVWKKGVIGIFNLINYAGHPGVEIGVYLNVYNLSTKLM